jgi:glutamine synthetase
MEGTAHLDPDSGEWPGPAPQVSLLHPGHRLLSEAWTDRCERLLHRVYAVAEAIGAPIRSVEVEMGPSQFEAVFDPSDALQAADDLVLFRNAIVMALQRESLHASFSCLAPFAQSMASGWHVHQSLVDAETGENRMMRNEPARETDASDAAHFLSDLGEHYLSGLLSHAQGITLYCVPTANAYARFRPNALAPQSAVWGYDNRGAMLRVIGGAGEPDTRIENRLPEAAANPYLCLAAQIEAGLDGIARKLRADRASEDPYATAPGIRVPPPALLPASLEEAIAAALADRSIASGLGEGFVTYFCAIKSAEARRRAQCPDPADFDRREYFGRL